MTGPEDLFAHLLRLTDDVGMFEHANGSTPRRHLGYCVDDVARALVVMCRQPDPPTPLLEATRLFLAFICDAQESDGRFRNRLGLDRRWQDQPSVEDCWGRALWGLGTAAARSDDDEVRHVAAVRFSRGASRRSPSRRSMAFAALGAAEILAASPGDPTATALLTSVPAVIGGAKPSTTWPWPEPRLAYANASLPDALIAAGEHLDDQSSLDDGLRLLGWLLEIESRDGHLSVSPVGGWAPGEARPAFDQQPIEVASLADACARALRVTGDRRWAEGLDLAIGWFLGDNDASCPLFEPTTGGGYDGLHPGGRNANQGAESTLAMVATLQHAGALFDIRALTHR